MEQGSSEEDFRRRFEVVLAVLLGLAAIATATAAYLTDLRDGDALKSFQEGNRLADQASRERAQAGAKRNEDQLIVTFALGTGINNSDTNAGGEEISDRVINLLGSEELKAAFAECSARPECDQGDVSPIDTEFYKQPEADEAKRLDAQADAKFADANANDEKGDGYSLVTVLLATALFLYGVGAVAHGRGVKLGTAGFGAVIFLSSLVAFALA
jgi:hypothetical protein